MEQVDRPISSADLEFYEGVHVRAMAMILAGVTEEVWNGLPVSLRKKWLDRSLKIMVPFFNTKAVVEALPRTLISLQHRIDKDS